MLPSTKNFDFTNVEPTSTSYLLNPTVSESRIGGFHIVNKSMFEIPSHAIVNSVNCVGIMGAGIALEFKKRYPEMYDSYRLSCKRGAIRPGDCHSTFDKQSGKFILNLAVKNDWKNWSTLEWLESSIKSLKLTILENDIKSVNLPVLGGENGRRGPLGKIPNMTPPPDYDGIVSLLQSELTPFANKFNVEINLCIPEKKQKKEQPNLDLFFTL